MSHFAEIRNRYRTVCERFLVEEPEFFANSMLFDGFWRNCYARIIDDLQEAIKKPKNINDQNKLILFLKHIIFEGVSLFSLLLRANFSKRVRYEILLLLAQLKHLQNSAYGQQLVEEAAALIPEDGRALFLLAKFAMSESDLLLALYWCLSAISVKQPAGDEAVALLKTLSRRICDRPGNVLYSPSRLKYMKPAKRAALDSTLLAATPILQLVVHGITGQLGSTSHYKHLDTFAHARLNHLPEEEIDIEAISRIVETFWMALLSKRLFPDENISLPQAVMLAGLFRFMCKYGFSIAKEGIPLFSGKNYEIACKIYPFFATCLHEFLEQVPKDDAELIGPLVGAGLLLEQQDGHFVIRSVFERSSRISRSMKVLTHRFLEARVSELASPIEAAERLQSRPWKIVDYEALLADWDAIKSACQGNTERYFISLALIDLLDVAKQSDNHVREIIRFIHNAVTVKNPSIRLQSVYEESSALRIEREEFKKIEATANETFEGTPFTCKMLIRYWCEHLKAIRYMLARSSDPIEIFCKNRLFLNERRE